MNTGPRWAAHPTLHGPLDPVLRRRRGPGLAGQERREIRPLQDPPTPARRLRAGPAARERTACAPAAARPPAIPPSRPLPDTIARLVCFTVADPHPRRPCRKPRRSGCSPRCWTTRPLPGRRDRGPVCQKRWLIEIAFLHLKRTVRGAGRVLRGRSPDTRPPGSLGTAARAQHDRRRSPPAPPPPPASTPARSPSPPCSSLARAAVTADTCCPHCGKRPTSAARAPRRTGHRHPRPAPPPARTDSGPPAAPPPNDEKWTAKKSLTPSTS